MAQRYIVKRAQLRLSARGTLPRFNEDRALRRAQEKSADELLTYTKSRARAAMNSPRSRHQPVTRRGKGMVAGYRTNVRKDGSISLYNRTFSSLLFEGGTKAGFPILPVKGVKLKFNRGMGTPFVYPNLIRRHPGQRPRPIMAKAMRDLIPNFERNLAEAIEEEWNTVGAR